MFKVGDGVKFKPFEEQEKVDRIYRTSSSENIFSEHYDKIFKVADVEIRGERMFIFLDPEIRHNDYGEFTPNAMRLMLAPSNIFETEE